MGRYAFLAKVFGNHYHLDAIIAARIRSLLAGMRSLRPGGACGRNFVRTIGFSIAYCRVGFLLLPNFLFVLVLFVFCSGKSCKRRGLLPIQVN